MTKKDFELIARVLKSTMEVIANTPNQSESAKEKRAVSLATIKVMAQGFSHELKRTNPLFNSERFLTACGVVEQ